MLTYALVLCLAFLAILQLVVFSSLWSATVGAPDGVAALVGQHLAATRFLNASKPGYISLELGFPIELLNGGTGQARTFMVLVCSTF